MDNTFKFIQKVKYYKYKSLERKFVVKDDKGVRCVVIVMQCIGKKSCRKMSIHYCHNGKMLLKSGIFKILHRDISKNENKIQ